MNDNRGKAAMNTSSEPFSLVPTGSDPDGAVPLAPPSPPKIAVTCCNEGSPTKAHPFFSIRCCCVSVVRRLGAVPFLVPPMFCEASLSVLYDLADGILIPGGADVSPVHYGGEPHPAMEQHDGERDLVELYLARRAIADKKPLLGICRGMHVINVAQGGTLVPDLADHQRETHWPKNENHHDFGWHELAHDIEIVDGSLLADLLGITRIRTNSLHHQCIGFLGEGLRVTSSTSDGVPESLEAVERDRFLLGVQSHPETLCNDIVPAWEACFTGLIRASAHWRDQRAEVASRGG